MITPLLGLACLLGVLVVAFSERANTKISYFDVHAAAVVVGGVLGSLLLAIERHSLYRMLISVRELFPSTSVFGKEIRTTEAGLTEIAAAWRDGRRAEVLKFADKAQTIELRVAADSLLRQLTGANLAEQFTRLRVNYTKDLAPVIEGWELVGKIAPSFGMVGTVTGMVQLFRNMGDNSGNLGGAMAMALLATLYGISLGAAVGGPMATRTNNQLNDRLVQIDLIEKTVASLIEEHHRVQGGS